MPWSSKRSTTFQPWRSTSHLPAQEIPLPRYLTEALPRLEGRTGLTLASAYNDIEFSAAALPGLEVVNVLTNAVRRGLTGNLGERGWRGIGGVMIDRPTPTYVHAVGFGHESRPVSDQALPVLRRLGQGGRPMCGRREETLLHFH